MNSAKRRQESTDNARRAVHGTCPPACSVWASSSWSPIREMVCLACCDVRDMKMRVSEIKLFRHRFGDNYERRLEHLEDKVRERQEIVKRLFQTRHFKTPNKQIGCK